MKIGGINQMTINFFRTIVVYIIVVAAMRIMGKRQIGEMQPSELVITLMISELATLPVTDVNIPLMFGIVPILTLVSAEIILSYVTLKSKKARRIITGEPSVIIVDGEIIRDEMEKLRINSEDLTEELRQASCVDINEVAYGILETNGKLSIIKKKGKKLPKVGENK
jgi:uncharacterized membrane protein YcaP (DUF421 family)